jgi:hypothetical protein
VDIFRWSKHYRPLNSILVKLVNGLGGLRTLIIAGFGNIIDKVYYLKY